MVLDIVKAYGHPNVLCKHETTIELTKDKSLTKRGDCILGIKASKACFDLEKELKSYIWDGKRVDVVLKSDQFIETFHGFGHKYLPLTHKRDLVFRKSEYKCNRTVLIKCSKSSRDLSKDLVNNLKASNKEITVIFRRVE